MKIKKTEKRLPPLGSTVWFKKNENDWRSLRKGEIIEIPEKEYEAVKARYGASIEIVDTSVKETKKHSQKRDMKQIDSLMNKSKPEINKTEDKGE